VLQALRKDKKREASRIHFVLVEDIGQARVEEIEIQELERLASEFPEILRQRSYP
jgi:3-dehydroquinate synthetase